MENFISKEVFKTYYEKCRKVALIMSNKSILEDFVKNIKDEKCWILNSNLAEDKIDIDDNSSSGAPIDPIHTFYEWLKYMDDEESKKSVQYLKQFINDEELGENIQLANEPNSVIDGNMFGELVRNRFHEINWEENNKNKTNFEVRDFSSDDFKNSLLNTSRALEKDSEVKFIFEGAFELENNLRVRPDILEYHGNKVVSIYEAKASTSRISKEKQLIKKEHLLDIFYQAYTLEKLGFIIKDLGFCFINGDYSLDSESENNLFYQKADLLKENLLEFNFSFSEKLEENIKQLESEGIIENNVENDVDLKNIVRIVTTDDKEKSIFQLYFDFKDNIEDMLFEIDYKIDDCLNNLGSINYADMSKILINDCYIFSRDRKNGFYSIKRKVCSFLMEHKFKAPYNSFSVLRPSDGVEFYKKYPYFPELDSDDLSTLNLYSYTKNNKTQSAFFDEIKVKKLQLINSFIKSNFVINDRDLLIGYKEEFFETVQKYEQKTIYMYDFETSSWAVPVFNKQNPYDQTVFQYSIHVLEKEEDLEKENYDKKHMAWLKREREDPRPEFLYKFIRDAFSHGPGIYVAYNKSFEIGVLRKLAVNFPKYAAPLMYIASKTIDLWDFFKKNMIYHPDFKRSTSIKYTQPALYPNLQYKDLIVNNGLKASYMFRQYIDQLLGPKSDELWESTFYSAMLSYCNRDTEAMIVLFKRIIDIYNSLRRKEDKFKWK